MPAHPLVARLDAWLRRHRPLYYQHVLTPGAKPEQIDRLTRRAGSVPPLLLEMLSWRNGGGLSTMSKSDLPAGFTGFTFVHNRSLMPVGDVCSTMDLMAELVDSGDFDSPDWWHLDWVPFLHNGGGDYTCIDLGGAFGGQPGQILEFWHDDGDRSIAFDSFETWLRIHVEAFEAGLFVEVPGEGFIPVDEIEYHRFLGPALG